MQHIFFTNLLANGSFLKTKLLVKTYQQLRPGQSSYYDMVWHGLNLDRDKYQANLISASKIDKTMGESLFQDQTFKTLGETDFLMIWDLRFVPTDTFAVKKIIETIFVTKKLTLADWHQTQPIFLAGTKLDIQNYLTDSQDENFVKPRKIKLEHLVMNTVEPESAQELMISNLIFRPFNELVAGQFIFTKTSSKINKIKAEHNFLSSLPLQIKHFYPQILELRISQQAASYDLERIFFFDVAVLIKNQSIFSGQALPQLFERLTEYLSLVPRKKVSAQLYQQKLTEMFVDKLATRVEELAALEIYPKLNQICQQQGFLGLSDFHSHLHQSLINQIQRSKTNILEFSHGDLSACNLLFDLQTQQLKLVDPRGWEVSEAETWRPIEYDLAKLSHSFIGGFDLISADLAKLVVTLTGVKTEFLLDSDQLEKLATEFRIFVQKYPVNMSEIRLYEASLFLSLIPLHNAQPAQNLIQLARALEIYAVYQASALK